MECKMEAKDLMSDIISNLPPSIIQTMLALMPMRDAFKTSILSKNWKDHCVNMPKLKFDDQVFQGIASKKLTTKYKLLYIVYPILLLHQGPILDFSLSLSQLSSCCEIDQIIRHLSNNATVKNFNLCIKAGDEHKLLPSFFTLEQLMYLKLENCAFEPPSTFKGFSKLIDLSFYNVSITSKVLLRFILNCPLLKGFTLIGDAKHFMGCSNSDFVELFECLPLVEYLRMSSYPIKCFATGVMPQKFPPSLVHLNYLHISGLCFAREIELRSALILTTRSRNIVRIEMEMCYDPMEAVTQAAMNFLDLQDYSYVTFEHLREIKITNFTKMKPLMDFVKLILAKSPILRFVVIDIDKRVHINDENQMLKELIQYQRASTKAQIIFASP